MLLIDEGADVKLATALEALKEAPDASRCIYFNLMGMPAMTGLKEAIIDAARKHIGISNPQLYFCDDGDICILAPTLISKDARSFILDIVTFLNRPATDDWVSFYDVSQHVHKLLITVEQKLEIRRAREAAAQKLLEQQQQERKREAILKGGIAESADDIKGRRANRATPELMMIEDDAFSRRLVENVLQKKYPLTALAEATHALSSYARLAPDLLFLDINLPDVTGHDLLERILLIDPDAYVIMLSGNADQNNIVQAMSKGAKGFIAKPFTKDKLLQYIDRCPGIASKQQTHSHA